ncbi:MAG: hypothetical protein ACRD0P_14360, partial [Stackebrandtia sp.]
MNQEDERDLETGGGELADIEDPRMEIEIRVWSESSHEFSVHERFRITEQYVFRPQAEWFGIVTTHIPRELPVGTYAFTLNRPGMLVAAGEFAWDGRVATRREGA